MKKLKKKTSGENIKEPILETKKTSIDGPPRKSDFVLPTSFQSYQGELPIFLDFKRRLEDFQKEPRWKKGELFFWMPHFHAIFLQSLSAIFSCLDPRVSQQNLLSDAEEFFGNKLTNNPTDLAPVKNIRLLRNTILKILVFIKRASEDGITTDAETNRIIHSEMLACLDLIEKWHTRPKGKIDRRRQRGKKRKSPPRKYGSEFMDKCAFYVREAVGELGEFITREGVICNSGIYEGEFTPKIFPRKMPNGVFAVADEYFDEWSKWMIDMLRHRARQGDLCRETLRKRKKEVEEHLIPALWDSALNNWKR
jgi:hypothetical protein